MMSIAMAGFHSSRLVRALQHVQSNRRLQGLAPHCDQRAFAKASHEGGRVIGPRYQPSLQQTLRNTRGRELLRIVDIAVPNLKHPQEFSVILRALALDGQWRRALRLLREMKDNGISIDVAVYNEVLSAMAKDKKVEKALSLLVDMRDKNIAPDLASYNNCIGACKPDEWARALHILEVQMLEAGFQPDGQSFEWTAAACEEGGEWQRSLMLFLEIGHRGLNSTSVGHNYALSACRQGKQWKHGLEIIAEMSKRNFEPDFRLRQDLEAQSRGLERAPPPEPSRRTTPSPDNLWQRKQQLRELREQDKRRQEERRLEQERERKERERQERLERERRPAATNAGAAPSPSAPAAAATEHVATPQPSAVPRQPGLHKPVPRTSASSNISGSSGSSSSTAGPKEAADSQTSKPSSVAAAPGASTMQLPRSESGMTPFSEGVQRREEAMTTAPEKQQQQQQQQQKREPFQRKESTPRRDPQRQHKPKSKLRAPGSYVLPVFAQHDRSNHAERQALIKVIARVQEASGAQTDEEFEAECAEVTGTVRLYASHTPCISCMACFCQFQRLFPKVKLCVDFDDWRDTRRMVELARREEEHKKRGTTPINYDCAGLSDMSDEEEPESDDEESTTEAAQSAPAATSAAALPA